MKQENQNTKPFNGKAFSELTQNLFTIHGIDQVLKDNAKAFVEVMGSPNFEDANERQSFMESFFRMNLILQAIKDNGKLNRAKVLDVYYALI